MDPQCMRHERVDQCAQIRQAFDRKPWLDDNRLCASTCLGHPRRQQRQREIRLPDNEVRCAGVTPRTDYRDGFTAARVKRIEDPNLNRRTPGSMTLLRPAAARAILRRPLASRSSKGAGACCSPAPPILSSGCKLLAASSLSKPPLPSSTNSTC